MKQVWVTVTPLISKTKQSKSEIWKVLVWYAFAGLGFKQLMSNNLYSKCPILASSRFIMPTELEHGRQKMIICIYYSSVGFIIVVCL